MAAAPPSDYATGSAKSEIKGIGKKTMSKTLEGKDCTRYGGFARHWCCNRQASGCGRSERGHHNTKGADAAASVVKEIERAGERRSQFRRTPLMPAPSKPRSKGPWRHSGGSNVLVNNAGTAIPKTFEETTLEELDPPD